MFDEPPRGVGDGTSIVTEREGGDEDVCIVRWHCSYGWVGNVIGVWLLTGSNDIATTRLYLERVASSYVLEFSLFNVLGRSFRSKTSSFRKKTRKKLFLLFQRTVINF